MSVNDVPRAISDDSRVTLQIVASLTDDSRHVIYNRNMFIVYATGGCTIKHETTIIITKV